MHPTGTPAVHGREDVSEADGALVEDRELTISVVDDPCGRTCRLARVGHHTWTGTLHVEDGAPALPLNGRRVIVRNGTGREMPLFSGNTGALPGEDVRYTVKLSAATKRLFGLTDTMEESRGKQP